MQEELLISVIIPCFNSEKYIGDAVASVRNQSYKNIEIIVVDDSSTDDSFNIVKRLADYDKRIRVYRIEHTGLPSAVRNYGISQASGELIAFLDSDDIWTNNKLAVQTELIQNNSGVSFVYSMSKTFGDVHLLSPMYEVLPLPFRAAKNREGLLKTGNTIPLSSVLIRSSILNESGAFDEDPGLKAVEDYDLWLRLSESQRFLFIPRIHVYYRIHKEQSSADWETKARRNRYLSEKRNINIPPYKLYRGRNTLLLFIRNIIHFKVSLAVRLLGILEKFK